MARVSRIGLIVAFIFSFHFSGIYTAAEEKAFCGMEPMKLLLMEVTTPPDLRLSVIRFVRFPRYLRAGDLATW